MRTDGNPRQWPRIADLGVPFLVAAVQFLLIWFLADGSGDPLVAVALGLASLALVWRRAAPVPALAATILLSALAVTASGTADAAIGGLADGVALYSLAVRRGRRQAVAGCLTAYVVGFAVFLQYVQGPGDLVANGLLDAVYYVGITAFGQLRRQRRAARDGLRARLAEIERESRAAAAAERERLAREIHDLAGHHLSAVVVHAGAAARRGDPELIREALTVAAETGRDVLRSLSGLVDVVGPQADGGGLKELLPPLCHGLKRLGVPVSLTVQGRARKLSAEVTTVAYRIVQESLTNATRYASGAPVRVTVRYLPRAVVLTIDNEPPAGGGTVPALGGGRGVRGMRERAAGLGGALRAGPTAAGGWSVAAHLPTGSGHGWGWPGVLDSVTVVFCAAPPVLGLVPPEPLVTGRPVEWLALIGAVLVLRAVPLWWRRRAPCLVLGTLTLTDSAFAVACGLWSEDLLGLLVLACPAQLISVYSVACYNPRGRRTWPAPLVAPVPWGLGLGLLLAADPEVTTPGTAPFAFTFGLVIAVLVTAPVTFASWAWGLTIASRSRGWEDTEHDATARASEAVRAERDRVAAGLNGTVLDRTARLVAAADSGLAGAEADARAFAGSVAELARDALTETRALLDALEEST
ncbi:histidine kinase [Spirillospora sp. NBC_00431]